MQRIGMLPETVAARALTPRVLEGYETPSFTALCESVEYAEDDSPRWHAEPVQELLREARRRYAEGAPTASDAWLAPRLHHTLRLTRAEASDRRIWNFLGVCLAPDFVRWRWGRSGAVAQTARFAGRWDLQCFSRLWWAAELFRDGSNYRPVELACGNQDILNTTMRLEMTQHRPAAQALLRLHKRAVRTGRDVNAAAAAANAAGATLVYEALAPDELQDAEALREWIEAAGEGSLAQFDSLPIGPHDGSVPHDAAEALTTRFEELFAQAPVRGKVDSKGEEGAR
ncbi:DUF6339 family protein [Streptomyces sp. NPDC096068]|uniref:DUF6339 family protein n=1 Tax=Streptomyces sp. NPDC096068 TaxID=3155424 RepID=UPI0033241D5C